MATFGRAVRRGLPRHPGGDPWPPAGEAPIGEPAPEGEPAASQVESPQTADASAAGAQSGASEPVAPAASEAPEVSAAQVDAAEVDAAQTADAADTGGRSALTPSADAAGSTTGATAARAVRRGLPRVPGGEPWPPASFTAPAATPAPPALPAQAAPLSQSAGAEAAGTQNATGEQSSVVASTEIATTVAASAAAASTGSGPATAASTAAASPAASPTGSGGTAHAVRRGLPRVAGGEPWPPADYTAHTREAAPADTADAGLTAPDAAAVGLPTPDTAAPTAQAPSAPQPQPQPQTPTGAPAAEVAVAASVIDVSVPLPFTRTVWQGAAGREFERQRRAGVRVVPPEPKRYGPFTRGQWAGAVVVAGAGLLFAAAMAVFAVRWLLSLEPLQDFLTTYPGEYHLPEGAPVGFPAWLGWQHFFNVFLMVLIIRSGLQVRTEKRPTAFWSPRRNSKRKISLALWFHQSLDILWVVNGVIFVVLLFVSGQWMRIIPTSWEVFPNAIAAALQYVSLDWPTENGWVNYNSLQQLAYFTTVFLAAPLAIITGVRMSGIWPSGAKTLNRLYPVEIARAVHFPVMLYFVVFIAIHVFLVFATGALRNLNHMYAAQGSPDPGAYAENWTGFWFFVASLAVIAIAWVAARPLVLAPIARLFGKVSSR